MGLVPRVELAAARGASVFKLIAVSRHKSVDKLRGYIRRAEVFEDHAAEGLLWRVPQEPWTE